MFHQSKGRPPHSESEPVTPSQPQCHPEDLRLAWQVIEKYTPGIPGDDHQYIEHRVLFHLDQLKKAFPNLHDLRDKRILDLACGSRTYEDDTIGRYEPWMSRLLLHLGARPVGIDLTRQQGEEFAAYQVDLTVPDALEFIDSSSFDGAYICAFPTRKAIHHLHKKGLTWPEVRENILFHMRRCLKPEGIIIRQFSTGDEELVRKTLAEIQPPPPITMPPYNLPRHYFDDDEFLL